MESKIWIAATLIGAISASLAGVAIRSDEIGKALHPIQPLGYSTPKSDAVFPSEFTIPDKLSPKAIDLIIAMPDCEACSAATLKWDVINQASRVPVVLCFPNKVSKEKWKRVGKETLIASEDGLRVADWFWNSAPRFFRVSKNQLVEEVKPDEFVELNRTHLDPSQLLELGS